MGKRITLEDLEKMGAGKNLVDDLLDRQIREIEEQFGEQQSGIGNKMLSLFVQNGVRVQLSRQDILREADARGWFQGKLLDRMLDKLVDEGLLRILPGGDYELANNVLARRANQKIEAENRILRGIKATIADRMSRNQLLDEQYLNYIKPSLSQLELTSEETDFVEDSRRAIERRKRNTTYFVAAVFAALFALAVWALRESNRNLEIAADNEAKALALADARDSIQNALAVAQLARDSAFKAGNMAIENAAEAQRLARELSFAAAEARAQADSADDARRRALYQRQQALEQKEEAERLEEEARALKIEADEKRAQAEEAEEAAREAREIAEAYNGIVISRNAAARALDIESPKLKAVVAREAFNINVEEPEGDIDHPFIHRALHESLKALTPGRDFFALGHRGAVRDIIVDAENKRFYSAGSDGRLLEWTYDRWNAVGIPDELASRDMDADGGAILRAMALHPDHNRLLLVGDRYYFQEFRLNPSASPRYERYFQQSATEPIFAAAYLSEGDDFLGVGRHYVHYFDPALGVIVAQPKVASTAVELSSIDGKMYSLIVSGQFDSQTQSYRLELQQFNDGRLLAETYEFFEEGDLGRITAISFRQEEDQGIIVFGFQNGQLRIAKADIKKLQLKERWYSISKQQKAPIFDIVFSEDGNNMAAASLDGTVTSWDLSRLKDAAYQPLRLDDHRGWATALAYVPGTDFLLVGTQEGSIHFWNLKPASYALEICKALNNQFGGVDFDKIDAEEWRRYFGRSIKQAPVCRVPTPRKRRK